MRSAGANARERDALRDRHLPDIAIVVRPRSVAEHAAASGTSAA